MAPPQYKEFGGLVGSLTIKDLHYCISPPYSIYFLPFYLFLFFSYWDTMINRRTLLGSLAALFSGASTLLADSIQKARKVYLTIHSDKKDSQYGIENGSIEIHDSDSGKMRKIRVEDGVVHSNDEVTYKRAVGGLIGFPNDTIPILLQQGYYTPRNYKSNLNYELLNKINRGELKC